jgi:hypothetical protein
MRVHLPESPLGVLAWLAMVVFACYLNALSGAFQFDDYKVIVDNSGVQSWGAWLDNLGHGIRPLLKFSYTLNWTSGMGVMGFHLTNLLIHLGNAYLVYLLSGEFVRCQPLRDRLSNVPLLTALLFAAHPIHTEAVTYICGRSISLMTLFYLAGLLAYATGRMRQNKVLLYGVTPGLFVIALSVKETAVTFPFALLAWELGCGGKWKTCFKQQWTSWAMLLFGALFFLLDDSYLAQMERSAGFNSLRGNLATQAVAFAYLLRQWLLPLWLNIDPELQAIHGFDGVAPQLFLLVAVFILMLYTLRRRPWMGFALAWVLIQLLPLYILLPRLDVANDRQMYLAGWPLALAGMAELSILLRRRTMVVTAALLVFALGCLTYLRNQDYRNEIALWENTLTLSPNKARAHNNLGYAYLLDGRNGEARREFTTALKLDPGQIKARYNLMRLDLSTPAP